MRERLIELLSAVQENATITCPRYDSGCGLDMCKGCQYDKEDGNCDYVSREADYLIDNGVIVSPCKVGQTVYIARNDINEIIEGTLTAIIQRQTFQYAEIYIEIDNRKTLICLSYRGEILFATREEAEQALKEGAK